jgi:hypothetical protein
MTARAADRSPVVSRYSAIATLILASSFLGAIFTGCKKCDDTTPRVSDSEGWTYYDYANDYALNLTAVEVINRASRTPVGVVPATDQRGDFFSTGEIDAFVSAQGYGFWLDLVNRGAEPATIAWDRARYVDENGREHEVHRQAHGPLSPSAEMRASNPTELQPGQSLESTVVPIFKSYVVAVDCDQYVDFNEPLVPANARTPPKETVRNRVRLLARKGVPVKLIVPVRFGSADEVRYVLSFELEPFSEKKHLLN